MRAGAHALSLLSVPLNAHVLEALAEEPRSLVDLRRAVGSPPQTTMRGNLRTLTDIGVLERRRQGGFPGSVDYQLGAAGRELLAVATVLQDWLAGSPEGPLALGSVAAKSSIKALVEGWSAAVVRALAAKPFSLTELSTIITGLSYPALERRLGAMRVAGQIERCTGEGRGTPYAVTDWLRQAVAPLAAAACWERSNLPLVTPPVRRIDIETAFLLALPLVDLPATQFGSCRLAVDLWSEAGEHRPVGVSVRVVEGRIVSCVARLAGDVQAWASGSPADWLRAVKERDGERLETGGDSSIALALVEGLPASLLGTPGAAART